MGFDWFGATTGRTERPNLMHYATPSRMLREAPPAAGPTGTAGRARATPELHGAVRSGTAVCGPNLDHGPRAGSGSYASTLRTTRPLRPADPQGNRGARAGGKSCVTQSGHTDVDVMQ